MGVKCKRTKYQFSNRAEKPSYSLYGYMNAMIPGNGGRCSRCWWLESRCRFSNLIEPTVHFNCWETRLFIWSGNASQWQHGSIIYSNITIGEEVLGTLRPLRVWRYTKCDVFKFSRNSLEVGRRPNTLESVHNSWGQEQKVKKHHFSGIASSWCKA